MTEPRRYYRIALAELRGVLEREQRRATLDEWDLITEARAAAETEPFRKRGGPPGEGITVWGPLDAPEFDWGLFERFYGPVEPPPAEPQAADHENPPWPVQLIRDILDRAREGKGRPTILDELGEHTYFNGRGATDHVVRTVLRLFKHDDNAPRRLETALEMALEIAQVSSPARATVTLETLENAVLEADSE